MKIKYFYPHWGSETIDFNTFCKQVADAGYTGIEMNLPEEEAEQARCLELLEDNGLELLAQHAMTRMADFDAHLAHFTERVSAIAALRPQIINCHTGRDWYTFEQNQQILDAAQKISDESGVRIIHETHRGRFSFCAAILHKFMEANPTLRLCTDFSHWCAVSESFLHDQEHFVTEAIQRADMIHARIGHDQGPQINDPRAPEWSEAVERFFGWWDQIVECHKQKGSDVLFVTTEFGPEPYMPTLPVSQEPVASQWEVNLHMLQLFKQRYSI